MDWDEKGDTLGRREEPIGSQWKWSTRTPLLTLDFFSYQLMEVRCPLWHIPEITHPAASLTSSCT